MRSALRLAMESEETDLTYLESAPEDIEFQAAQQASELEQSFNDEEALGIAYENLSIYRDYLRASMEAHTVTPQVLQLVRMGVQQQLNRVSMEAAMPSMESHTDLEGETQIALESIGSFLDLMAQDTVINLKQTWSTINGWVRSTESNLERYQAKLHDAHQEFNEKKNDLNNLIEIDLHALWKFFSNHDGPITDFAGDVGRDLNASKYILQTYPKQIVSEIKKLASTLNGAKGKAGVLKALKTINGMKNPSDLFDARLLDKKKTLLSNVSLHYDLGSRRSVVVVDGKSLTGLADLASPRTVKESKSWGQKAIDYAWHGNGHGNLASMVLSPKIEFSKGGLEATFDYAQAYLDNARAYLQLSREFGTISTTMERAITQLNHNTADLDAELLSEAHHAFTQVSQYAKNLMHAFTHPATEEVKRSISGAKYCMWLGLRGIYNG